MLVRTLLACAILATPFAAQGHELLVIPDQTGARQISVLMTEDFIKPDHVPPLDAFAMDCVSGKARTPLTMKQEGKALTTTAPGHGCVLAASLVRDRMETAKVKEGEPAPVPRMVRAANYAKSFSGLSAQDSYWSQPTGSRLEVMPISNPTALKVGDTLRVRLLFEGQPITGAVQASFDGNGRGWPVRVQAGKDGIAEIPLSRSGLWVIRTKYQLAENPASHAFFDGAANIVVAVTD